MPGEIDAERILNVFRQLQNPHNDTLTTQDLEKELPVEKRTVQKYVKELEQEDRLVLAKEGKPNQWQLADIEPSNPVYDPRLGKAKRLGNLAHKLGLELFFVGVGVMAGVGVVMSNQQIASVFGIGLPLGGTTDPLAGAIMGFLASLAFLLSFLSYVTALTLPRIVEWWLDDPLPGD
jgi:hypothetical protein